MKTINIELKDTNLEQDMYGHELVRIPERHILFSHEEHPMLFSHEIDNIINKFDGRKITKDEVVDALDLISLYIYQERLCKLVVDIDERNRFLAPAKEMTMEEIEKELGYKVKIVSKENKND